jgi:8-oxo-dGTP pyrophosphatase MutT (NUDIX family)
MLAFFGGGDKKDKTKEKEKPPSSPNDYLADKLQKIDLDSFAASGILVFNSNGPASLEMLLGRSSQKNEIEFLGGKRDAGEDVYTTAAREFDEETGGVLSEIKKDLTHRQLLIKACRESPVFWYARGRYALFLVPAVKLHNLVSFDPASDSLPKRHRAFMQSGKAKSQSSSFQEMKELMWMPFSTPQVPHGQKARDFMRSVFDCAVFKVWLHGSIYGARPCVLHLTGLDWNTKKDDIKAIFEQVGGCKITLEPHDDASSSYKTNGKGIVTYEDRHHAITAVYLFNKSTFGGRTLSVAWALDQGQSTAAAASGHQAPGASGHAAVGGGASHAPPQPSSASHSSHLPGFQPEYTGMRGHAASVPAVAVSHVPPPPAPAPTYGQLPHGWIEQRADNGIPFFVHVATSYTTWDRPPLQPHVPPPSHAPPPPLAPHHYHSAAPPPPPQPSSYHTAPPPPPQPSSYHTAPPPPPQPSSYDAAPPPPVSFLNRGMPPQPNAAAAYGHHGVPPPAHPPPPASAAHSQHPQGF